MNELNELIKTTSRIEQKLDTTHKWVESLDRQVFQIQADMNKAKGGWIAIVGISALAGSVGGLIGHFLK